MTPARLRELAAAVDPRDRLAVLIEADAVSREPVTTEIVSDALMRAAKEIERLTQCMSGHRGLDLARIEGANMGGSQDLEDIADLCAAVRGQGNEIERLEKERASWESRWRHTVAEASAHSREADRLRALAREGWTNFAAAASFFGNEDQAHRCATALAEIEAAS